MIERGRCPLPRESAEAKALAVDVARKREKFHGLMAERAALLLKLKIVR